MPPASKRKNPKAILTHGRGKSAVSIVKEINRFTDKRGVPREYTRYAVYHFAGKKQIRKQFSDLDKAKEEAEAMYANLRNGHTAAAEFTDRDRHIYNESQSLLERLPLEIRPVLDAATKEFVEARLSLPSDTTVRAAVTEYVSLLKDLPDGVSIRDAIDNYLGRQRQVDHEMSIPDAVERFIESRESLKRSREHIRDLDVRLTRFAEACKIPVSQLTAQMVQTYLNERRIGARSKANEYKHIRTLVRWAVKQKYAPRELLEDITSVELPEIEHGATLVFTPDELAEILVAVQRYRPDLLPAVVICAFCGLRSAEVKRLNWSEIRFSRGIVEVTAGKAKTRSRRVVPLCETAREWLLTYVKPEGPVCPVQGENRLYEAILSAANRRRTELKVKERFPWKRNGLRHGWCSYRLAQTQNINQVAMEAGNSPAMIDRHYRELVDPEDAERWFDIQPPKRDNVIAISAAA